MKVAIVIITAKNVEPACWEAAVSQTHDSSVLLYREKPLPPSSSNYIVNLYKSCSACREQARKVALAIDAEAFVFLDSDIVMPLTAVEEFVRQARPDNRVIGGWYKIRNDVRYACGRYVADNTFANLLAVERSLVRVDMVGLGCAFIPRDVLELISFRDGTDLESKNAFAGNKMIVGECGVFGDDVDILGVPMYMDGDVICEHLERKQDA